MVHQALSQHGGAPHIGDEPAATLRATTSHRTAPHARGCTSRELEVRFGAAGGCPARAGIDRQFWVLGATCKTLGVAARLSPLILRVNTPLSWISTACSGPEGPAASQKAENKGIDVFSTERRDTGG